MSSSKGYTEKKVLAAIKSSGGIITTISNRIGCEWHTAKNLVNRWESTKQAYKDERETILDMSESTLLKSIKDGDTQSAKWMLSTLGRERGFNDRLEIVGSGGESIKFEIVDPKKKDADTPSD